MDGTPYTIDGREFVVPRLRVAAFEAAVVAIQAAEAIGAEADPFGVARLDAVCGAAVDLLRENHPDLTVADMKRLVYVDELDALLAGLLRAGGKRPAGEAVAP
jgi:hypothetical protein